MAGGGQNSSYPPQQGFSSMMGGQGVGARGRNEGGGLMLNSQMATATPSTSLSSALNMVSSSHDQDDSVFSPSSVEDERMKFIEQVNHN